MLRSIPALTLSMTFLPSLVSAAASNPNFIIIFTLMGQSDRKLTETARAVGRLLPVAEFYVSPSGNDANPAARTGRWLRSPGLAISCGSFARRTRMRT